MLRTDSVCIMHRNASLHISFALFPLSPMKRANMAVRLKNPLPFLQLCTSQARCSRQERGICPSATLHGTQPRPTSVSQRISVGSSRPCEWLARSRWKPRPRHSLARFSRTVRSNSTGQNAPFSFPASICPPRTIRTIQTNSLESPQNRFGGLYRRNGVDNGLTHTHI